MFDEAVEVSKPLLREDLRESFNEDQAQAKEDSQQRPEELGGPLRAPMTRLVNRMAHLYRLVNDSAAKVKKHPAYTTLDVGLKILGGLGVVWALVVLI